MVQIYCDICQKHQPLLIEKMHKDLLNEYVWGDLLCSVCLSVIASLTVDEPGVYEFRKVSE